MAYIDQGDPDLLVFRSGGGLLALFGLPFGGIFTAVGAGVMFGRGSRITARSDRDSVSFGIGLSRAEAEYLVALIKKALVS